MTPAKLTTLMSSPTLLSSKVRDQHVLMDRWRLYRIRPHTVQTQQNFMHTLVLIILSYCDPWLNIRKGRSHGLTQIWLLHKDRKTGLVDKTSLQQVPFEEQLYEVFRYRIIHIMQTVQDLN